MQKAAAAASAFGLDFKHLGAYIATVADTTRQEASSIGTAFNTILARWHSIKKTGFFTDEDGVTRGTNDIDAALKAVDPNLSIFDKNGQWRDMGKLLDDLAKKWPTLTAAQKAYLSTTMAGTKQQNVFLALMNDMSQGIEGQSTMYRLLEGSMNSAGTVATKYETYLKSVQAAQDRFTIAMQKLYDVFVDGKLLSSLYDLGAGFVDTFATGLDGMG